MSQKEARLALPCQTIMEDCFLTRPASVLDKVMPTSSSHFP